MTTLLRRMFTRSRSRSTRPSSRLAGLADGPDPRADRLRGNGRVPLHEPAGELFRQGQPRPEFASPHTACWRGYIGTWEIKEDTLYLSDIKAWMRDEEGKAAPVAFEQVFPGKTKPLKAEWFTGTLRIPQGKPIRYVHMGYQTVYEVDVFLTIEAGKVIGRQMVDNRNKVPANSRLRPGLDQ